MRKTSEEVGRRAGTWTSPQQEWKHYEVIHQVIPSSSRRRSSSRRVNLSGATIVVLGAYLLALVGRRDAGPGPRAFA